LKRGAIDHPLKPIPSSIAWRLGHAGLATGIRQAARKRNLHG